MTEYNRCCNCEKNLKEKDKFFHFRKCYNTNGKWAHRICEKCWWEYVIPNSEKIHFKCFGCDKHWPLWFFPKTKQKMKIKEEDIIQIL